MTYNRSPLGLKQPKPKPNPERVRLIHYTPCVICFAYGFTQRSPTEAHHCKSGRYSQARECDDKAIGLCHGHHNRLKAYPGEENHIGFHNSQEQWEAEYGKDYDLIQTTNELILAAQDDALGKWL